MITLPRTQPSQSHKESKQTNENCVCVLGFSVNDGTHALQLRETTRGGTNIGELKIEFDGLDAYDAPVDIVMQKSPS